MLQKSLNDEYMQTKGTNEVSFLKWLFFSFIYVAQYHRPVLGCWLNQLSTEGDTIFGIFLILTIDWHSRHALSSGLDMCVSLFMSQWSSNAVSFWQVYIVNETRRLLITWTKRTLCSLMNPRTTESKCLPQPKLKSL